MNAVEVAEFLEDKFAQDLADALSKREETKKAPCKYCTENYFVRYGRLGTVYTPVDIRYCPMCGRPRQTNDLDY